LTDDQLPTVLDSLRRRLNGDSEERAMMWESVLLPWLKTYWPTEGVRNTPETSREMVLLLLECGDAFPKAVAEFSHHLKPGDQYGLYGLENSDCVSKYPEAVFDILTQVVGLGPIQPGSAYRIQGILDSLKQAWPALEMKPEFREMYRQATF